MHEHHTKTGGRQPAQRYARARRAGILWLVAALAAILTQVVLWITHGGGNLIDAIALRGVWAICAIFGFERLGWTRGYRAGRAAPQADDRAAKEVTTP